MDNTVRKYLYIENLGCAKNQVDAEVMARSLEKDGWTLTREASEADLIMVNTCGFIESAREESINTFFSLKSQYPKARIIISGCLAQRYGESLREQIPEADGIFGNRDLAEINVLAAKIAAKKRHGKTELLVPEYPDPDDDIYERDELFNYPGSAYLKISEGCNHRCGFCAIPVIRGPLRSRPYDTILKEARELVASGIREINLIAQDLAAYGTDVCGKSRFLDLLSDITAIDGDFRVRLLYIHPDAFPPALLDMVRTNPKIMPYFDIPIQHASVPLLRNMKRAGDAKTYTDLVSSIRSALPESVIRTTIMLGFPGETDDDFEQVRAFVEENRFNWMGSFVYSREEETFAWGLTDEKTHKALTKVAKTRQKKLQKIQEKISSEWLQSFVGKEYDVLIEELIEGEDLAIGRFWAQAPEVDGLTVVMGRGMVPGNVYRCGITKVNGIDLEAVKI
ncbi:MAG: 30S ribosomal protein S12 methylthiotransferase RimO [Spirochaetales bacterium]|nr:30S ribosomal protein S12 methylthiotransferase RimO [Spirochaetales bacterium]